jgi:hypothetical protein
MLALLYDIRLSTVLLVNNNRIRRLSARLKEKRGEKG